MPDDRNSDALAALVTLAARLRDTAASVAERADSAARSGPLNGKPADGDSSEERRTEDPSWGSADFGAITDFAAMLRDTVPDDLKERLSGSVRETLLSTRALIDWYLERDAAQQFDANSVASEDPNDDVRGAS